MIKKTVIFIIVYIILSILLAFVIFGWNAFGGSNSTNFVQKAITFFFTFPAYLKLFEKGGLFTTLFVNAFFFGVHILCANVYLEKNTVSPKTNNSIL